MPLRVVVSFTSVDQHGNEHEREQTMVLAEQPGERITSLPELRVDALPAPIVHPADLEA